MPNDDATAREPRTDGSAGSSVRYGDRELRRDPEAGVITGVCAGLGDFTRIDPIVWRTAFAITALAGGTGLWLYGGAWLLMRDSEGGPAMAEQLLDRRFAPETVLTLLGLALALATVLSIAGSVSGGTLILATPLIIGGLTAHSRGVDLTRSLRDLPSQLKTADPPPTPTEPRSAPVYYNPAQPWVSAPSGPVDLSVVAGRSSAEEDSDEAHEDDDSNRPCSKKRARCSADSAAQRAREKAERRRDFRRARRRERGVLLFNPVCWFVVAAVGVTFGVAGANPWSTLFGPVLLGSVVTVIGVALLVGAWFGDRRGLVSLGAVVSLLAVAAASTDLTGLRFGEEHWRPTSADQAQQYELGGGKGQLDLTAMDLESGERVDVGADVRFGKVEVLVPETARVNVHATAAFGKIEVGEELWSGSRLDVRPTMEPGGQRAAAGEGEDDTAEPAELDVRLASHGADMEVRRVER